MRIKASRRRESVRMHRVRPGGLAEEATPEGGTHVEVSAEGQEEEETQERQRLVTA